MQPDRKDMARLWGRLDAAKAVLEFTQGRRFEDLLDNRMLRNVVERNLEIIGEAARSVSDEVRSSHPEIPWRALVALRNVLAHEYGDIRYERLWTICSHQLTPLIKQLETIGVNPSGEGISKD